MHRFFSSARPVVFAHRGGSALAAENTMGAFANGLALGADGVELDVHLSRDGAAVINHDEIVDRTTTGRGAVSAFTAGELGRLGIPTLADVLAKFADARVIIEMKQNTRELAAAVVEVVRRARAVDRVCLGSFGRALARTRDCDERVA